MNFNIIFNRDSGLHTHDITMKSNPKIRISNIQFGGAKKSVISLPSYYYTELSIKVEAAEDFPNKNTN